MDFSLIFLAIDKKDFECVEKFFSSKNIPTIIIKESFKQDDVDYQEEDEEEENSQVKIK